MPSYFVSAVLVASTALSARAVITPTAPWSTVVSNTGSPCEIQWDLDTTGTWKNVSIFLNTGPNDNFVQLEQVATGIDGTTGTGKYTWTCPNVTPNAPIYFYTFSNNGAPVSTWTTRFTIASSTGAVVAASNPTQPDGSATPWGTGALVGGASAGTGAAAGSSSSSSSSTGSSSSSGTSAGVVPAAGSSSSSSSSSQQGAAGAAGSAGSAGSVNPAVPVAGTSVASPLPAGTTIVTVTPSKMSTVSKASSTISTGTAINAAGAAHSTASSLFTTSGADKKAAVAGMSVVLALAAGLFLA